jgi:hypothetical protein
MVVRHPDLVGVATESCCGIGARVAHADDNHLFALEELRPEFKLGSEAHGVSTGKNVPFKCTRVQDLTLKLLQTLKLGNMRTRVDPRSDDDFVKVLWARSFYVDYPAIVLIVAMHAGDYCAQAQSGSQVEVLYIVFEVLLHMAGCAMTGCIVGERKVCEAALFTVSMPTYDGLESGGLPFLWRC